MGTYFELKRPFEGVRRMGPWEPGEEDPAGTTYFVPGLRGLCRPCEDQLAALSTEGAIQLSQRLSVEGTE